MAGNEGAPKVIMIVTPEKLEANRRNAAQSTGPVTAEGKSRSASNSTKSGWFARELQVHPADQDRYASFRQTWLDALQPDGPLEAEAFADFLRSTWRKQQVIDAQDFVTESADPLLFLDTNAQPNLDRLLRYEAQFERRAQRALSELKRLQTARALAAADGDATPAPPLADPAKLAAKKRTQIAATRAAAISPALQRTLAIITTDAKHLDARARAFAAGMPLEEIKSSPLGAYAATAVSEPAEE